MLQMVLATRMIQYFWTCSHIFLVTSRHMRSPGMCKEFCYEKTLVLLADAASNLLIYQTNKEQSLGPDLIKSGSWSILKEYYFFETE